MGKILSLGFLSIGVILLMQVVLPIISFQIWEMAQGQDSQNLITPTSSSAEILGVSIESSLNFSYFVSDIEREYQPNYSEFSLSVPRLNLDKVEVVVDTNELINKLAHLPGTALPGEKGNVFISGHSAVNPLLGVKKAFFAKLTDLKKGDEIVVEANRVKFKYQVVDLKVVDPGNVSVIAPPDTNGRYITLMTCVPPGLNFKRLIVLGKML
ncbi:MAG: class E sortase [Candidatus Daviesbacteria bacterium]|nr:class E sortase [Candidatus Daviesbacteria bacterium]